MPTTQRRIPSFDARSVLLFAALTLGGAAASHAQTTPRGDAKAAVGTTPTAQPSFGPGPAPSAANASFDRADTNKDHQLSPQEAATLPAIGNRFEQLDTDKNGFLSRDEFHQGAQS